MKKHRIKLLIVFIIIMLGLGSWGYFNSKKDTSNVEKEYIQVQQSISAISPHQYDFLEEGQMPLYNSDKCRYYKTEYIYGHRTDVEYMKFNIYIYNMIYDTSFPDDYIFQMHDHYLEWNDDQRMTWITFRDSIINACVEYECELLLSDIYDAYEDYYEFTGCYINNRAEDELICEDWISLLNWVIDTQDCMEYKYINEFIRKYIDN